MADDTRQPKEDLSREALTLDPTSKSFTGSQWQGGKQVSYRPPENANMIAGGTQNTAGGQAPEVTLGNAFDGGIKWSDFAELPKRPCVRDALMTGIGSGFAFGGIRAIFGAAVWTSCSWAVGSFCLGAPVMYQYCLYKRQAEREGMMRAVEILNRKDMEKKAREARKEKAREERRLAKEQEQDAQFAALAKGQNKSDQRPWWKVW